MFELLKKAMFMGMGLAALTTEKIEEWVQEVVKKGEMSEKEGKELVAVLVERSKKFKNELQEKVEKIVADSLQKLNIPTRREVEELRARIERLEKPEGPKE